MIIQGTHPFMDGHHMFHIYGTLIIVIIYSYTISSLMKDQHGIRGGLGLTPGGPMKMRVKC